MTTPNNVLCGKLIENEFQDKFYYKVGQTLLQSGFIAKCVKFYC